MPTDNRLLLLPFIADVTIQTAIYLLSTAQTPASPYHHVVSAVPARLTALKAEIRLGSYLCHIILP